MVVCGGGAFLEVAVAASRNVDMMMCAGRVQSSTNVAVAVAATTSDAATTTTTHAR